MLCVLRTLLPFELLYRDIKSLRIFNFDLDYIEARLRKRNFHHKKNLVILFDLAEFDNLKSFIRNKELIIQKADKGTFLKWN